MSVPSPQAFGYCVAPAVIAEFAANAPWIVTTITGILASIWYARQLYKDFKSKDDSNGLPPPSSR